MFYNYKIKKEGNKEYLYLYLSYDYEFSKELLNNSKESKAKRESLKDEAIKYIKNNKIKFKGDTIKIVVGGVILFTLILGGNINYKPNAEAFVNRELINYVIEEKPAKKEVIAVEGPKETIIKEEEKKTEIPKETVAKVEQKEVIKSIEKPIPKKIITKTTPKITQPKKVIEKEPVQEKIITPKETITENPPPKNITPPQEPVKPEPVIEEKQIKGTVVTLYRSNGIVEKLALEDYIIGVVCAEMPASFNLEALKAQSVAARTYALKRIAENKKLTDTNYHQSYKDAQQMKSFWGADFNKYFTKIKGAVESTRGEYVAYNNYYIDALFHSTNNGKTEDPIYVWGGSFPYLKSVDSHWDLKASTYYREINKTFGEVSSLLGFDFNKETNIQIVSKTTGDRVNEIIIDNNSYTGNEIRDLFGLRSSDFDINVLENSIKFSTRGYGHGVGMSQYGANGMANEGYNYKQILNHYYPHTKLLIKAP
ncbi:MAG: stage II sporulation protein D [Bacilli bacterium]|nr:stage II sporulation protein D [Bacilli bacterium]